MPTLSPTQCLCASQPIDLLPSALAPVSGTARGLTVLRLLWLGSVIGLVLFGCFVLVQTAKMTSEENAPRAFVAPPHHSAVNL